MRPLLLSAFLVDWKGPHSLTDPQQFSALDLPKLLKVGDEHIQQSAKVEPCMMLFQEPESTSSVLLWLCVPIRLAFAELTKLITEPRDIELNGAHR